LVAHAATGLCRDLADGAYLLRCFSFEGEAAHYDLSILVD
jgi:hypothetical protein